MDPYREFNHALKRIIRFLEAALPDQGQVHVMRTVYKTMKGINRRWPHKCFYETLEAEHSGRIRNKDEAFFMSPDFTVPLFTEFVDDMKQVWRRVDTGFKERMWEFLNELIDLSRACQLAKGQPAIRGGDENDALYSQCFK